MKLALVVLCIGAATFLLRVLAALVREYKSPVPRTLKTCLAKFRAPRQQGELIVMDPEAMASRFPAKTGQRIALGLFAIRGAATIASVVGRIVKF